MDTKDNEHGELDCWRELTAEERAIIDECFNDIDLNQINTITTEINCIDKYLMLSGNEKEKVLADIFNKAIDFIENHTEMPRQLIIEKINKKITFIDIVDDFPDTPYGIGYVDNLLGGLYINQNILKNEDGLYKFILHEITHMMSGFIKKQSFFKKDIMISGYLREINLFSANNYYTENESFNEAAVEMFVNQDNNYREEKVFDYTINTNQDSNGGLYCLNSNLIHQMLIARGISKYEFFEGLYDYKKSKNVIKKFKKKVFKKISTNMDDISEKVQEFYEIYEQAINILENDGDDAEFLEKKESMRKKQSEMEKIISKSERIIIDQILCPRLKSLPMPERQQLLSEYEKFIISEKEYFRQKTNYQFISVSDGSKINKPWIEHIDAPYNINRKNDEQSPKSLIEEQGSKNPGNR